MENSELYPDLQEYISTLDIKNIPVARNEMLHQLIDYIQKKVDQEEAVNLNFICTHNSRRSQYAQLWASFFADRSGMNINSFSGGVEITACNHRIIDTLRKVGFDVSGENGEISENPHYIVTYSSEGNLIVLYSKLYDGSFEKEDKFGAVMCCAHADDNCPFIPNAEVRIPLRYEDPKAFDDTTQEKEMYLERCTQIATEMKYIFSSIKL